MAKQASELNVLRLAVFTLEHGESQGSGEGQVEGLSLELSSFIFL